MKKTIMIALMYILCSGIAFGQIQNFTDLLSRARQGDADAMCDVGTAYFEGQGVLKDPFKAKCWIQKAYNNNSQRAEKIWNDLKLWEYPGKCELSFDDQILPRHSKADKFIEPVTGLTFVYVPGACFKMGCHEKAGKCRKEEKPVHEVCLDGFWIGALEVDQGLWKRIMGTNPSRFSSNLANPVENVSFHEVMVFISRLNSKSGHKFDLPTEAQWEVACRNGGEQIPYPWEELSGNRPVVNCGDCDSKGHQGRTAPCGSYMPNTLGLYDMGGNVKEWCKDKYNKRAYSKHEKKNPLYTEKGISHVVRGGAWTDTVKKLRCSARDKAIPSIKTDNIGFRLVLERAD